MFFKRSDNTRPTVKKASELINAKSHKQKKYISLMLVPSYSMGKTRSLRVPRAVFHGAVVLMIAISAVITGFWLRSVHFERMAVAYSETLGETLEEFYDFQIFFDQVQSDLIDTATQMYDQLSEEQLRAQRDLYRQQRRHEYVLEDIWDHIDELERQIRELDDERQEIESNLGARVIIPPVATIMARFETYQAEIRAGFAVEAETPGPATVGLMAASAPTMEEVLIDRLMVLFSEMDMQRQLMENLEIHARKMERYLTNFPTIWPVHGSISSGFGWRPDPMGSGHRHHHNGVDIPAGTGTPIRAAGGGTVTFAGWRNGYGNTVIIDHGIGISTFYAHASRFNVTVGQKVSRGDVIAFVGSTGRSTAPHLHYEVIVNGVQVNPIPFLKEHHS